MKNSLWVSKQIRAVVSTALYFYLKLKQMSRESIYDLMTQGYCVTHPDIIGLVYLLETGIVACFVKHSFLDNFFSEESFKDGWKISSRLSHLDSSDIQPLTFTV